MCIRDSFKVVSVAAWCAWHSLDDSRRFGAALRQAIEESDSRVAVLASGSLSHRFNAVSYTHLDVYKRQGHHRADGGVQFGDA